MPAPPGPRRRQSASPPARQPRHRRPTTAPTPPPQPHSTLFVDRLVRRHLDEGQPEQRATSRSMAGHHRPTLFPCHLGHDGQTQTRPRPASSSGGSIETVEDVLEVGVVDPRTVVPDDDRAPGAGHLDHAPVGAPLQRVVEQVPHGPFDATLDPEAQFGSRAVEKVTARLRPWVMAIETASATTMSRRTVPPVGAG